MRAIPTEVIVVIALPFLMAFFKFAMDYGYRGVTWFQAKDNAKWTFVAAWMVILIVAAINVIDRMIELL